MLSCIFNYWDTYIKCGTLGGSNHTTFLHEPRSSLIEFSVYVADDKRPRANMILHNTVFLDKTQNSHFEHQQTKWSGKGENEAETQIWEEKRSWQVFAFLAWPRLGIVATPRLSLKSRLVGSVDEAHPAFGLGWLSVYTIRPPKLERRQPLLRRDRIRANRISFQAWALSNWN